MAYDYFAGVDSNGAVRMQRRFTVPHDGPNFPNDGLTYHLLEEPILWSAQPRPTCVLHWNDGAPEWRETLPLAERVASCVAQTYLDVDAVYETAIGNRTAEYTSAEEAAIAFLAADPKPIIASDYITGHALNNPTGQVQSEAWAAQQIIERADAFRWAALQMRNVRFAHQSSMREAATHEELDATVASWNEFITWLRGVLGL